MVANGGIAVAKFVAFAMTGASSMLAEGVHSVADTGNQALLLWGGVAARRTPDEMRPFGYGRERYFWAFVVALVMFSLGGVYAIVEGVQKFLNPHAIERPEWAIGVLALGIVLEGASFVVAFRQARQAKGKASWWDFVRRTKLPELPTVLLEDLGALVGLALALVGVSLATVTQDSRFDAMGSMAIGVLLVVIAIVLTIEMRSLLIGESASVKTESQIQTALAGAGSVLKVRELRTQHIGPEDLLVGIKAEFDLRLTSAELAHEINRVEAQVRAAVPIARFVYIEPAASGPPGGN
jgi:cation diffusion facilitator family transporter